MRKFLNVFIHFKALKFDLSGIPINCKVMKSDRHIDVYCNNYTE